MSVPLMSIWDLGGGGGGTRTPQNWGEGGPEGGGPDKSSVYQLYTIMYIRTSYENVYVHRYYFYIIYS